VKMHSQMIVTAVLRAVQIICAAVILGLSATVIKGQVLGSNPTINYAAVTGGFSMLGAIFGFTALFVESLPGLVTLAIDALASLLLLAGGIAITVKLRGINCSSSSDVNWAKMFNNDMLNGGCIKVQGKKRCTFGGDDGLEKLMGRCKEVQADSIFQFFSFLICVACVVVAFLAMKRGTGRKGAIV